MSKADFTLEYSDLTPHNLDCIKLLVEHTFPISYSEGLYHKIVNEYRKNTFFGIYFSLKFKL